MKRIVLWSCMLGVIAVLAVSPATGGQDVPADAGTGQLRWFDFFVLKGGTITLVLIALSVVTIALTIEHCFSIRRATIVPPESAEHIKKFIDQKKYLDAIKYTKDEPSMMGFVLSAGLSEASNGYAAMERAMEESLEYRSSRLFRKIEYLNVIGNVSPMIGLLGTVYGMILLFAAIHASAQFPGAREVADKISIALITTFWGLAVAIPALSLFAVFRNRIDVLTAECALTAERLLSVFKPDASPIAEKTAEPKPEAAPPAPTKP